MKTITTLVALVALFALVACGGGGGSSSIAPPPPPPPPVNNPVPVISDIPLRSIPATSNAFKMGIIGANFIPTSKVQWNGSDRPTEFTSDSLIAFNVSAADVADLAIVRITVVNPGPGGGQSNAFPFFVEPTLRPFVFGAANLVAGTGPAMISVSGQNFVGGSVARWNGSDRPTSLNTDATLNVSVTAQDLSTAGVASLTVFNPKGGGLSDPSPVFITAPGNTLALAAKRLIFDPTRQRVIASVSSLQDPQFADHVVIIDPSTATVAGSVAVGSGPNQLALSDDGSTLWVGLDGASAIQKVDMTTLTAGPVIPLGTLPSPIGTPVLSVESMAVVPGQPNSLVVARQVPFTFPHHAGVAVYDNGVLRGTATISDRQLGANTIVFGADPTLVFGLENESLPTRFHRLRVSQTGVADLDSTVVNAQSAELKFDSGRVFLNDGTVIDPATNPPTIAGKFPLVFFGSLPGFAPSLAENKVFYISSATTFPGPGSVLKIFDPVTFRDVKDVPIGAFLPNTAPDLLHFGTDSFVLQTNFAVVFIRSTAVLPPLPFSIATSSLPATTGNKPYRFQLKANGGFFLNWVLGSGSLPPGLFLDSSRAIISGTTSPVATDQVFSFTIHAQDLTGAGADAPLSILVKAGALPNNDVCSAATPISTGTIRASLSPHGDVDVFSFTGTQGASVSIETFGERLDSGIVLETPPSRIDTVVELLDSTCTPIAMNDDANIFTLDSQLSVTLPATGTYFVRVSDARGDGRPDFLYDLQLSGAH